MVIPVSTQTVSDVAGPSAGTIVTCKIIIFSLKFYWILNHTIFCKMASRDIPRHLYTATRVMLWLWFAWFLEKYGITPKLSQQISGYSFKFASGLDRKFWHNCYGNTKEMFAPSVLTSLHKNRKPYIFWNDVHFVNFAQLYCWHPFCYGATYAL